jgi:hypothetical protein
MTLRVHIVLELVVLSWKARTVAEGEKPRWHDLWRGMKAMLFAKKVSFFS